MRTATICGMNNSVHSKYENGSPYDFFTDETANALVLEKIRSMRIPANSTSGDFLGGIPLPYHEGPHTDRKTCICNAALALIDRGAK